jgi:hypothetical protein
VAETTLATTHSLAACPDPGRHCIPHGTDDEPLTGYHWCPECQHMFPSTEELLAAHNEHLARYALPPVTDPEQVQICPVCQHNF